MSASGVRALGGRAGWAMAGAAACVVGLIAGPMSAAQASYPGENARLAFGMADSGGRHIYTVQPHGRGQKQLTDGPFTDLCPAWSPNGRSIAFCSNRSGSFEIWTMTAEGHRLRQLTNLVFASFPDYSSGGDRIAFDGQVANDPHDELFVMNRDGSDLQQITSGSSNNDWPAWSPDGRRLAFISDRTGVEQVFTSRPDGTGQTQLTFQPVAHDQLPDWRPDGRQLAYAQGDPGVNEKIWVMNADGSAQHQVSSGNADDFGPAWAPDGKRIAFVRDFGNGDRPVVVMSAHGGTAAAVDDPTGAVTQYVRGGSPAVTTTTDGRAPAPSSG